MENLGYCVRALGRGRTDPALGGLAGGVGGSGNSPHTKEEAACHQERNTSTSLLGVKMLTSWGGGRGEQGWRELPTWPEDKSVRRPGSEPGGKVG